jgi:hypothetical protein
VVSAGETAAAPDLVDAGVDPGDGRERAHDEEEHDEDESEHDCIVYHAHDQRQSMFFAT